MFIKRRNSAQNNPSSNNSSNNHSNSSYEPANPPSYPKKPFTKANLHELITELIAESDERDRDTSDNEGLQQDNESTMLIIKGVYLTRSGRLCLLH